jgi:hypothetical protein
LKVTKKQWEKIRHLETFDTDVFYDYFIEAGGNKMSIQQFAELFHQINGQVVASSSGLKRITQDSCVRRLKEYYERKFGNEQDDT